MGSYLSKRNRVEPIGSSQGVRNVRNTVSAKRFCCCFGNKVAPVCSSIYTVSKVRSGRCSDNGSCATINRGIDVERCSSNSSVRELFIPRSEQLNRELAFQCSKKPLPKIGAKTDEPTSVKSPVKGNGSIRSISFAVDINGMPIPTGIISNAVLRPLRLRKLPEIEKRIHLAKLKENMDEGRSSKLIKTGKQKILTKDMLERLEAEKQREINLRCREKQIQADIRRQLLHDQKEEKLREAETKRLKVKENIITKSRNISAATEAKMGRVDERKEALRLKEEEKKQIAQGRQQNVKQNIDIMQRQVSSAAQECIESKMRRVRQYREAMSLKAEEKKQSAQRRQQNVKQNIEVMQSQVSSTAQESIESKMRCAEQRREALRLKAEEKKERARIRRLRASIKSRLSKLESSEMNTERKNVCDDEEPDDSFYNEIETVESDEDPDLYNFNDENDGNSSEDSDSFWSTSFNNA